MNTPELVTYQESLSAAMTRRREAIAAAEKVYAKDCAAARHTYDMAVAERAHEEEVARAEAAFEKATAPEPPLPSVVDTTPYSVQPTPRDVRALMPLGEPPEPVKEAAPVFEPGGVLADDLKPDEMERLRREKEDLVTKRAERGTA